MKILVLGGTNFIGRNLVERLEQIDEFDITLFNRGTNKQIFSHLNLLIGDRRSDVSALKGTSWDVIIDLSAYHPSSVERIFEACNTKRYIFISTCSVYDSTEKLICRNEDATVLGCSPSQMEDDQPQSYGSRKSECERIIRESISEHFILRPALVIGKYDSTDRLYYWAYQIKNQSTLILPNSGLNKFSITYVEDLINTIVESMTNPATGTYNVITKGQTSISEIVSIFETNLNLTTEKVSMDPNWLLDQGIQQWLDIPIWLNSDYFTYSNAKLLDELKIQPTELSLSLKHTCDYYENRGWNSPQFGMNDEVKADLIVN